MKVSFIILIFTGYIISNISVSAQETILNWTPGQCISYAIKNNPDLCISRNNLIADSLTLKQIKAQKLPSLSFGAGYGYAWNMDLSSNTVNRSSSLSASASADLTLYNGGKINKNITRQQLNTTYDEGLLDYAKIQLVQDILNYYLQLLYYKEEVKIYSEQLALSEKQKEDADVRFEMKDITKVEHLQISSEVNADKLTLLQTENKVKSSSLQLCKIMHLSSDSSIFAIDPSEWFPVLPAISENTDYLIEQAIQNRPEIRNQEIKIKMSEKEWEIAKCDNLPSLSLRASSGWNNDLLSQSGSTNINNSLGLTLSIPIFNRFETKTNIAIQKLNIDNARQNFENEKYNLMISIYELVMNIEALEAELDLAKELEEISKETYNNALESYALGKTSTTTLLEEKTNYSNAQYSRLINEYNLLTLKIELQLYIGNWQIFN